MRCANTATVVAVEVLVEEDVVPEMWVVLHFFAVVEDRASGGLILEENACEASGELVRDLTAGQIFSRAGRALDREIVPIVLMELLERFDEQVVDRHPNGAAPI